MNEIEACGWEWDEGIEGEFTMVCELPFGHAGWHECTETFQAVPVPFGPKPKPEPYNPSAFDNMIRSAYDGLIKKQLDFRPLNNPIGGTSVTFEVYREERTLPDQTNP